MRCSAAALTARAGSAPPSRARRTEAGSGSRRQASHSSLAVCSVRGATGPWPPGEGWRPCGGAKPGMVRAAPGTWSAAIALAERARAARHAAAPGGRPDRVTAIAHFAPVRGSKRRALALPRHWGKSQWVAGRPAMQVGNPGDRLVRTPRNTRSLAAASRDRRSKMHSDNEQRDGAASPSGGRPRFSRRQALGRMSAVAGAGAAAWVVPEILTAKPAAGATLSGSNGGGGTGRHGRHGRHGRDGRDRGHAGRRDHQPCDHEPRDHEPCDAPRSRPRRPRARPRAWRSPGSTSSATPRSAVR